MPLDDAAEALIAAGLRMPNQPERERWTYRQVRERVWTNLENGRARPRRAA